MGCQRHGDGSGQLRLGESNSAFGQAARAGGDGALQINNIAVAFHHQSSRSRTPATPRWVPGRRGCTAAGQTDATAAGYDAQANALNASAFGANSRTTAENAVALG